MKTPHVCKGKTLDPSAKLSNTASAGAVDFGFGLCRDVYAILQLSAMGLSRDEAIWQPRDNPQVSTSFYTSPPCPIESYQGESFDSSEIVRCLVLGRQWNIEHTVQSDLTVSTQYSQRASIFVHFSTSTAMRCPPSNVTIPLMLSNQDKLQHPGPSISGRSIYKPTKCSKVAASRERTNARFFSIASIDDQSTRFGPRPNGVRKSCHTGILSSFTISMQDQNLQPSMMQTSAAAAAVRHTSTSAYCGQRHPGRTIGPQSASYKSRYGWKRQHDGAVGGANDRSSCKTARDAKPNLCLIVEGFEITSSGKHYATSSTIHSTE